MNLWDLNKIVKRTIIPLSKSFIKATENKSQRRNTENNN